MVRITIVNIKSMSLRYCGLTGMRRKRTWDYHHSDDLDTQKGIYRPKLRFYYLITH